MVFFFWKIPFFWESLFIFYSPRLIELWSFILVDPVHNYKVPVTSTRNFYLNCVASVFVLPRKLKCPTSKSHRLTTRRITLAHSLAYKILKVTITNYVSKTTLRCLQETFRLALFNVAPIWASQELILYYISSFQNNINNSHNNFWEFSIQACINSWPVKYSRFRWFVTNDRWDRESVITTITCHRNVTLCPTTMISQLQFLRCTSLLSKAIAFASC
jgi:hypothetical protein